MIRELRHCRAVGEIRPSAAGPPRHRRRRRPETTVPGPLVVVGAVEPRSQGTFSHSNPTAAPNAALRIPPRSYDRRSLSVVWVRVLCRHAVRVMLVRVKYCYSMRFPSASKTKFSLFLLSLKMFQNVRIVV